jgi:hypothetical protein
MRKQGYIYNYLVIQLPAIAINCSVADVIVQLS